jgi:hypothetical protein
MNAFLACAIVILWNSQSDTLKSIEVTWDSKEGLFPRKFNEEEKSRISELMPSIEKFLSEHRSHMTEEEREAIHDPFFVNDIEITREQTTVQISFFRDLLNESYTLSWKRTFPLHVGEGGRSMYVLSDDFVPRRFTFGDEGKLIKPKRMTQPDEIVNASAAAGKSENHLHD